MRRLFRNLCLMLLMANLNACLMMPIMMGPMLYYGDSEKRTDPELVAVIEELIEESVNDLDSNRPLSEKILLGEIEVKDDIIPVLKLRQMLLSSLEKNEIGTFIVENENIDNGVESYKVVTVLNTQLYDKDGELWLAHQFVNMKDNRVLWSGNYNRLFPSVNSQ